MITINPNYFCEAAIYYDKHSTYDDGLWDSYHYHDYWEQERKRCIEGYTVGDMRITGEHYWYLNYNPIWLTKSDKRQVLDVSATGRVSGTREFDFPRFWDVDYLFFNEFEQAVIHGEHFIWLKPRGCGASYKASSMAARNFYLYPGSRTFMFAHDKTFLSEDGLFSKFLQTRDFINQPHPNDLLANGDPRYMTAFGKPSDFKKDLGEMHIRASTRDDYGREVGYKSEIIGMTFNDGDLQKHRGKRGKLIIVEEIGAFPGSETVINVAKSSVEELQVVYGTVLGLGTGGTEATDFGDMEKMVFSPEAYNIRCFDNIYDEGAEKTKISFFTGADCNIGLTDEFGNSLRKETREIYEAKRTLAANSPDPNALTQLKAEHPFTPQEAILRASGTVLPSNEAREWRTQLVGLGLHKLGIPGEIMNIDGKFEFKPNMDLNPIWEFPHKMSGDIKGCVVQYYAPYLINGRVPDDLYIIAADPYAFDQTTDGNSIGAAYVYMQPNNVIPGAKSGDIIVATYFGRPKTQDDWDKVLFDLARAYNAKIGFENDRGNIIDYAKRFKLLDWLAPEFELAYDDSLKGSKVRRGFGMHIGSGKENIRIHKGNQFLRDWLISTRGKTDEGIERMTMHSIFCPATLREIELYRNNGGNFDRISALRILVYYQKELVYKGIEATPLVEVEGGFFNRRFF